MTSTLDDDNIFTITSGTGKTDTPHAFVDLGGGLDTLVIDYRAMQSVIDFSALRGLDVGRPALTLLEFAGIERFIVFAGRGDDTLVGGEGDDQLTGGRGRDLIYGEGGNNELHGGEGNDSLLGGTTGNRIFGDAGSDEIWGNIGNDYIDGGRGGDNINGSGGSDTIFGGDGSDDINNEGGYFVDAEFHGGKNGDFIHAIGARIQAHGDEGRDIIYATGDDHQVWGDRGADSISVSPDSSRAIVHGGRGADEIYNQGDNSLLVGDAGNDFLQSDAGNCTLRGGLGDDTLTGGLGADLMRGGSGCDSFVFNEFSAGTGGIDRIVDFVPGSDSIVFSGPAAIALGFELPSEKSALPDQYFALGATPQNAAQRLLYEPATGLLRFDADGSGSEAAVVVAQIGLRQHPNLSASDFFTIP